jgi:anti-anti-sigma factor
MSDLAHVQISGERRSPTVAIVGEIDISNVSDIRAAIEPTIADAAVLVVDLSGTTFLDSAGTALLLEIADRLRTTRRDVFLIIPEDAPIRRLAKLTGLDAQVPVLSSRDDIDRSS